jgi:hypothetical protein
MRHARWQTVDEIAVYIGANPGTIYRWTERTKPPAGYMSRLGTLYPTKVNL